jgi:hypothetical protein
MIHWRLAYKNKPGPLFWAAKTAGLYFFGDKIASEAAGADLQGKGSSPDFGLYLDQIGLPGAA